jgi:hypothetical protein
MESLGDLARKKFPNLSPTEEKVVRAAQDGTEADCGGLGGDEDLQNVDGTRMPLGEQWPDTRNVRAELIRWLCIDREARERVDPRGVWIRRARITGLLDLSSTKVLFPILLLNCRLEQDLNLRFAKMPALSLEGSWTKTICANGIDLEGNILLRKGFHAEGEVGLLGATIGGDLIATEGTFRNPTGQALNADRAKIGGSIFMKRGANAEGKNGFVAEGEVVLLGAKIGGNLEADGGTFKNRNRDALSADGIKVDGGVHLRSGFSAEGTVRLPGATIGGNLDMYGGTFKNSNGYALFAVGAKIGGNVFMRPEFNSDGVVKNKFVSEGEVLLIGAAIGGSLDARGGTFKRPNGHALNADRAKIDGSVFMTRELNAKDEVLSEFVAEGEVRLHGATVGGDLNANGGTFKNANPKGYALSANRIKVSGSVFLRRGFSAENQVRLLNATVGGDLDATGGTFKRANGNALSADRAKIGGNVLMKPEFSAEGVMKHKFVADGGVRLLSAAIGGDLDATGGAFKKPSGNALNPDGTKDKTALNADSINVTGDIFLRNGFSARGEVRLVGATIGGDLDATAGTFQRLDENATKSDGTEVTDEVKTINADSINVRGSVLLRDKFVAVGEVWFCRAEINGQLEVDQAWLGKLNLDSAHIRQSFFWRNIHKDIHPYFPDNEWKSSLDLTDAKVGSLVDDLDENKKDTWLEKGQLRLDGFVYDRVAEGATDAKTRLKWLRLQPDELGFRPQPYRQLAKVLGEAGEDSDAKRVLVEMENARRRGGKLDWWSKSPNLPWRSWAWAWVLKATIGYGYKPFRAGWWVAAFVLIGFFLFSWGQDAGFLTQIKEKDSAVIQTKGANEIQEVSIYQTFNGFIYSLETFLPLVDLQFAKHWLPCATAKPKHPVDLLKHLRHWPFRWLPPWDHDFGPSFGKHLRWYFWFHILAGWFFTTMFVGGVTGLVRKD